MATLSPLSILPLCHNNKLLICWVKNKDTISLLPLKPHTAKWPSSDQWDVSVVVYATSRSCLQREWVWLWTTKNKGKFPQEKKGWALDNFLAQNQPETFISKQWLEKGFEPTTYLNNCNDGSFLHTTESVSLLYHSPGKKTWMEPFLSYAVSNNRPLLKRARILRRRNT